MSDSVTITILSFLFLITIALIFRNTINRAKKVRISLKGIEFEAYGDEFAKLFEKNYSFLLKRAHMIFFFELFNYKTPPTVVEAIPGFDRESEEWVKSKKGKEDIGMLRALRGLGFIEPKQGGKWSSNSNILITELGHEFKKYLKR